MITLEITDLPSIPMTSACTRFVMHTFNMRNECNHDDSLMDPNSVRVKFREAGTPSPHPPCAVVLPVSKQIVNSYLQ